MVHRQLSPHRGADPDGPAAPAAGYTASCRGWPTHATPGTPRVYDLALELISHTHGRVDLEGLRAFVAAYQSVRPLTLGELWAIPIMLRLALIENLRRVVARITGGPAHRELAGWVERMLETATTTPARGARARRDVAARPDAGQRVPRRVRQPAARAGPGAGVPGAWLEQRLAERGQTSSTCSSWSARARPPTRWRSATASAACACSARPTGVTFVEAMSVVEASCAAIRPGSTRTWTSRPATATATPSRRSRKRCPLSEEEVAEAAIALARAGRGAPRGHVGYFLVDAGRERSSAPSACAAASRRASADGAAPPAGDLRSRRSSAALALAGLAWALAFGRSLPAWALVAAAVLLAIACSQLAVASCTGRRPAGDAARTCCRASTSRPASPRRTAPRSRCRRC
jgi:cyclic beta-1,2-glucan synthetase